MKTIYHIKYSILIVISTLMIVSGCHQVSSNTPFAYLGLHMHTSVDSVQLDPLLYPNQYAFDSLGRYEKLTITQLYVSQIRIRNKSTQQWYTIPNSIILKRIQNELYPIGNVPVGTYDAIGFTVGLGNALNSRSPGYFASASLPAADSVLSGTEQSVMWLSNVSGMSGNTASGYTFLNVQGYDSTDHIAFSYQLGGYGDTAVITLPYPSGFTLAANEPNVVQYVHIIADYGKLLQNINLAVHPSGSFYSTVPVNAANAADVWVNIVNIFRYECPVPNGNC
jgi:hypothetical protein